MKTIFSIILILVGAQSYAAAVLQESHWTLKNIHCASGASPSVPANIRYDLHFLAGLRAEVAILRPSDWAVMRGTYALSGQKNLCMNLDEHIYSGEPTHQAAGSWCGEYEITDDTLNFTWVVTSPNGGDCAKDVPVTASFEKM